MRRAVFSPLYCEIYESSWHGCAACWLIRAAVLVGLAVLLACAPPPPPPRVPTLVLLARLEDRIDALIPRVHRLAAELEVRREIQAIQDDVLRARRKVRGAAMRRINLAARRAP